MVCLSATSGDPGPRSSHSPQAGASGTRWGSQDRKLGGQFPVRRHEPQDDLCVSPPSQGLGKDAQRHQPKATRKALETSSLRGKDPTDVTARALGSASCTGAQGHPTGTQALNQTGARTSFLLVSPLGPLLLLPPIHPSIRVFSNESTLRRRWPARHLHRIPRLSEAPWEVP